MLIILFPIALLAFFFIAVFLDSAFFDGKYLNRAKVSNAQFKILLESVLSQGDRLIDSWDPIPQDWIYDKMLIPLQDPLHEKIRLSVVNAIGDENTFTQLSPEAKKRIQEAIDQLK